METITNDIKQEKPELLMPSGTNVMGWHYAGTWIVDYQTRKKKLHIRLPKFYLVGQQTVSYTLSVYRKHTGIVGAALKPTAINDLFNVPAFQFTNEVVPIEKIGGRQVRPYLVQFQNAATTEQRIKCLADYLRSLTREKDHVPTLVDDGISLIFKTKGCLNVKSLCDHLKIGERSLQRLFREKVGVSPIQYIKIIRFNNIFTEVVKTNHQPDIQFLSALYGYYDISHFTREFKQFCNVPPSSFLLDKFKLLKELIEDRPYLLQVQHSHSK